jgi:hypothetical protein
MADFNSGVIRNPAAAVLGGQSVWDSSFLMI